MQKTSVRGCPICRAQACEVLHAQRFTLPEGCPLPAAYDVVVCSGCGFVFADTSASQADYSAFYASASKYADMRTSTGGGGSPGDLLRLRAAAERIRTRFDDRAAKIVDIGCANGGLLAALKEIGCTHLYGIDPAPACAQAAEQACGAETYAATLENLPANIGPFDVVILSHVLEHVLDLHGALFGVRALMKPSAILYVEVPDATRYQNFVAAPFQDFNTEHINHFSHASLENLARATGFRATARGDVLMEAAPGKPYPAIHQCWHPNDSFPAPAIRDTELRPSIERYIDRSRAMLAAINEEIRSEVRAEEPILIWGVGQLAMKLLADTALGTANIAGVVDSNPIHRGKKLLGHPILSPSEIATMTHPILIASTLHAESIRRQIRTELGMHNRLIVLNKVASL